MNNQRNGIRIGQYHRHSLGELPYRLAAPFILFIVSMALAIIAFLRMSRAYTRFGPAAVPAWGEDWLWIAAVLIVLSLVWTMYILMSQRPGIQLYDTGLFLQGFIFGRFLPWQMFEGISYSQEKTIWLPKRKDIHAFLWLSGKRKIALSRFVNRQQMDECLAQLKAGFDSRFEAACRQKLFDGAVVSFGALRLQKTGIWLVDGFQQKFFPWAHIGQINICDGQVMIDLATGRKACLGTGSVPNFEILLKLIREVEAIVPAA